MENNNKVSVIIPAYNEEKTIKNVINIVKKSDLVNEIIVVNNSSTDNTSKIAKDLGANVVECPNKGKGYAMEAGIEHAKNEIIVFLDADVIYQDDIVEVLANPILSGNAEMTKSTFNRTVGGVVTNISTKPLLRLLFPTMYPYEEPLSGMIAITKKALEGVTLEKDYGVDIGILIDMYLNNIKTCEVNIGEIQNSSHQNKTMEKMQNMATEVSSVILKKAKLLK